MIVLTLARKPLSGTVAQNALKYGTGGINIDACRKAYPSGAPESGGAKTGTNGTGGYQGTEEIRERVAVGRWPANVILQHLPGCRRTGTKRVKAITDTLNGSWRTGHQYSGGYSGAPAEMLGTPVGFGDAEGMETVEAWECAEGCPVAALDAQSGPRDGCKPHWGSISRRNEAFGYGGEGGASRFFKQVAMENAMSTTIPQDLVDYLLDLISPPPPAERAICIPGLKGLDLSGVLDLSISGILTRGTPTEEQAKELLRVLLPGAHLVLIAPDENPVGDLGACTIEDTGFEIRDSLLLVDEAQCFHYVPKAARAEREAGCHHLPGKTGAEAVDREDDTDPDNSRSGAEWKVPKIFNFHPTVKPLYLMKRLLADVPTDQGPVVDNFCGSGSTLLACIQTGHEGIGIEKNPEYLQIADARVRYWDSYFNCWVATEIVSEAPPHPEPKRVDMFNFGTGDDDEKEAQ